MDLEQLNKSQIILLTLFVSFVTSIATGIVTVSLMNQAPPQVAATVNHIIEHTVETVTPAQPAAPAVATTVKTVVVRSDDIAAQSIGNVQKSMIRIVSADAPDLLVARGLIIDAKGTAITDRSSLDPQGSYVAILPSETRVPIVLRSAATSSPVAILDLKLGTSTPALSPATFVDPAKLALGQTVIRIGGTGADTVGQGVIAALPAKSEKGSSALIQATVSASTPGAVLITLVGEVIGITTGDSLLAGADYYSMPSIFKAAAASADAKNAAAATSPASH